MPPIHPSPVRVMPWFNPEYYAYYWEGLRTLFPDRRLRIDARPFPSIRSGFYKPRDTFAFVIDDQRFSLSANDMPEVNEELLRWSDAHGKVNVFRPAGQAGLGGVVTLGPGFGVRAFSKARGLRLAAAFMRSARPRDFGVRGLRATLSRQEKRASLHAFASRPGHAPSEAGAYYLGSYWHQHPQANVDRVDFLRAARSALGDRLEGGLVLRTPVPGLEGLAAAPVSHPAYVDSVRRSLVVFNHDAVHGCLGWKLGEFLALGKAIITTPVRNALPAPLRHGEECHVVTDIRRELPEVLHRLQRDEEYRRHLEAGARRYWELHVEPTAALRRVLDAVG